VSQKRPLPLLGQPDPNSPADVHLVGRYAVGVTWGDQHGSIYPFDRLRHDCPCEACPALQHVSATAAWPTEIVRDPGGLRVVWADGHESLYPYADLRARCRCAGCTGGH
jgi:DUF971 family protein